MGREKREVISHLPASRAAHHGPHPHVLCPPVLIPPFRLHCLMGDEAGVLSPRLPFILIRPEGVRWQSRERVKAFCKP